MPGWPSGAERRELGAFPAQTGPEDVQAFFELSPEDLRFAFSHRGEARLGVAVQLCSLRWLGFVPDDLAELPQPALLALCEQLEADPDDLALYGTRDQTRSDHFVVVRDRTDSERSITQSARDWRNGWRTARWSTSVPRRCTPSPASSCARAASCAPPSTCSCG